MNDLAEKVNGKQISLPIGMRLLSRIPVCLI